MEGELDCADVMCESGETAGKLVNRQRHHAITTEYKPGINGGCRDIEVQWTRRAIEIVEDWPGKGNDPQASN